MNIMKSPYIFPFLAGILFMSSLVYVSWNKTSYEKTDLPILASIHYEDVSSHPTYILHKKLNRRQEIITVPAYNGMTDLEAEFTDGLLLKRSYITAGTSTVRYYQTFRYSEEGHLRERQTWRRHPHSYNLQLSRHDYFETNEHGQIIRQSSWMSYTGKAILKETFEWKHGNLVKQISYVSKDKKKNERTFRYDSSLNPWTGLNIFPDVPAKHSINNIVREESNQYFRSQIVRKVKKFGFISDPSGKILAEINPDNGLIIREYQYE